MAKWSRHRSNNQKFPGPFFPDSYRCGYVCIYIAHLSTLSKTPPYRRIFGPLLVGCGHKIVCFDDICCRFLNSAPFNPRPPHDVHREQERNKNIISKRLSAAITLGLNQCRNEDIKIKLLEIRNYNFPSL